MFIRLVLTLAEHLAFERDFHVLTIMDNLNAYIDLLHEILIAKNDVNCFFLEITKGFWKKRLS